MRAILAFLGLVSLALPSLAAETVVLESPSRIVVHALSEQALQAAQADSFRLFVEGATEIPVLGRGYVDGHIFVFEPRFSLRPGIEYRVEFKPANLKARLQLPTEKVIHTTRIGAVYPSSPVVPENLLKFYLVFSAPMSRGNSYQHITLFDESQKPVELPFIEIGEELWDSEQQRLTLLLDPGRIKRGLKPNKEVGPPLASGRQYTLVIDKEWQDARQQPLAQEFRKEFKVGPFDASQPDPSSWRLLIPKRDSRDPLTVDLAEPLDHALLEHCLTVHLSGSPQFEGNVTLTENETVWQFIPLEPWQAGKYVLRVDTRLEDLAGNSTQRAFEVADTPRATTTPPFVELPFVIE